jgi:quercetin dioxygenase-like cupin family protein
MGIPIERPTPVADLVEYQAGSVVSRVLFRTEGGAVTVFAFAEGEGLTEHSSPHEAAVLMLEGSLRMTVGDDEHELRAGEILHIPASAPHTLHGGAPFKMLLTLLKRGALT